jgi:hypothetical protein
MLMDGRAGGLATDHGLRLAQTSTTVEWPAADEAREALPVTNMNAGDVTER